MINEGRHPVLGINIDAVDYEAATHRIIAAAQRGEAFAATALAVHGVMTGFDDEAQAQRLNSLSLIVPDGQPVRWALSWLHGIDLPDRVYGPNLMLSVCESAAALGLPIYLYGSRPEVISSLSKGLTTRWPNLRIAGAEPSQFRKLAPPEKLSLVERIENSGAQVVFVGLGCPRQEVWAFEYMKLLSIPIVAVGAAFDFHAGNVPQAPQWMQASGLEWAYRLLQEPGRLWRRYLLLNPRYLGLVGMAKIGLLQKAGDHSHDVPEISYG